MNYKNISRIYKYLTRSTPTKVIVALLIAASSFSAYADGWALFSQQEQMKGFVIADVGEVSEVEPPLNTKWQEDVYEMNGHCFSFSEYNGYWGYGSKAAFLLVNAQKVIKLALIETSIGSLNVELKSVTMLECPTGSNVVPDSDDPQERLRLLRKQQEELKKKLDELLKKEK